jgi:hypothetical protein
MLYSGLVCYIGLANSEYCWSVVLLYFTCIWLGNAFSGQWCYCISLVYGWAMHLVVSGVIVFHLYMVGQCI